MIKTILKIRSQSSVKRKMLRNNIFFSRRKLPRKQMIINVFRNSFKVSSPEIYPKKQQRYGKRTSNQEYTFGKPIIESRETYNA